MSRERTTIHGLSDTSLVSALKALAIDQCGFNKANPPMFFFSNLTLDERYESKTLDEIGIENFSRVFVAHRVTGGKSLELVIEMINGEELKLDFDDTKTVKDLKGLIATKNDNLRADQMGL
jgi:hypothetical protein